MRTEDEVPYGRPGDMTTTGTPDPTAGSALDVRPLTTKIGAEIGGVEVSRPLGPEVVDGIRAALLRWRVVFFRDQGMDHAAHVRFARRFGELTFAHPYDEHPPDGRPEIYTVDPRRVEAYLDREEAQRSRDRLSYTNTWHTDVTPAVNPPAGSILRAETVPAYGGDTTFTNLVAAYEGLSPPVRRLVDGLHAEHRYQALYAGHGGASTFGDRIDKNPLVAHHPVVRVHPETGERALFVNPLFTSHILELNPTESRRILDLLFEEIARPAYTVRFRWAPGSIAFWDNRATAHLGPQDLDDVDVERVLYRVTLVGDVPVGVDGRPSELVEGVPFRSAAMFGPSPA